MQPPTLAARPLTAALARPHAHTPARPHARTPAHTLSLLTSNAPRRLAFRRFRRPLVWARNFQSPEIGRAVSSRHGCASGRSATSTATAADWLRPWSQASVAGIARRNRVWWGARRLDAAPRVSRRDRFSIYQSPCPRTQPSPCPSTVRRSHPIYNPEELLLQPLSQHPHSLSTLPILYHLRRFTHVIP
jgi:hypothetical protein